MCGCREKGCFLVTFARPPGLKKKEKGRKGVREWSIKSMGSHVCEPHEPRSVAIANSWIPIPVKALLVSLYDQNVSVGEAHLQAIEFASKNFPTTWEKSDVKNFFDTIQRHFHNEDIVLQLEALSKAGHFVAWTSNNCLMAVRCLIWFLLRRGPCRVSSGSLVRLLRWIQPTGKITYNCQFLFFRRNQRGSGCSFWCRNNAFRDNRELLLVGTVVLQVLW
jgi:hypothetical protein